MKNEERLARDLCYVFLKKLKEHGFARKVKRIIFCIETEDLNIKVSSLKEFFKRCLLNTPYQSAEVEFVYKYSINFAHSPNSGSGIYLEKIEFE